MKTKLIFKLLLLAGILLVTPFEASAQKYATRFLGFFVDGPKETMIENLKSKGFVYHSEDDYFTGVYFGEPVYIFLNTRDGKLNRVLVYDITQRDSAEVKQRFNQVYKRFVNNDIYVYLSGKKGKISTSENIAIGINQYSKNYRAVYGQKRKTSADSLDVQRRALKPTNVTQEDIKQMTSSLRQRLRRLHARALMRSVSTTDDRYMNQVWFAISQKFGKFAVIHSFDNLNNFTQPSDDSYEDEEDDYYEE